ncbi:hypothetical protein ACQP1V_25550 [Microtetraspora malaysiensis]|uniref:hypothetical protein n=1 Tax=Microtetraspora malaysiensis TaxID=161358 RepID=UPI003D89EAEF
MNPTTGTRSRPRPTCRKDVTPWPARSSTAATGKPYQNYSEGMEDQIGALGLVLNAIVLFNIHVL